MINDGIIKYENYNGSFKKGKGLRNKRKKKREFQRAQIREVSREATLEKRKRAYSKSKEYENPDFE